MYTVVYTAEQAVLYELAGWPGATARHLRAKPDWVEKKDVSFLMLVYGIYVHKKNPSLEDSRRDNVHIQKINSNSGEQLACASDRPNKAISML
jgi:hypothetical protein